MTGMIPEFAKRALSLLAVCGNLAVGAHAAAPQQVSPGKSTGSAAEEAEPLPTDWAPELFYSILTSANPDAAEALYRAAFAAGPAIVPQLEAALKDDRTAEFAAQSLAFIGGPQAMEILARLVNDSRDLDLRRFFYGALGEFQTPAATKALMKAVAESDSEPDRTVSEAAVLALTVRSDPALLPEIKKAETQIKDVVIHDDLDNAVAVMEIRAKYLASEEGRKAGGSIDAAVRTYFIPALEPPPEAASQTPGRAAGQSAQARGTAAAKPSARATPQVSVEVSHLTLSPDQSRALARVVFEDPSAVATYDMVLEKQSGNWTVASVWLGSESPKPGAGPGQ